MTPLSHVASSGRVHMVDVSGKRVTQRRATAAARVRCARETAEQIAQGTVDKGDVLLVARLAGIVAAKRTAELLPLCHPIGLSHVDVQARVDPDDPGVIIEGTAQVEAATGVEMEALVAVSIAALTVVDMIKASDPWAVITDVGLLAKEGGKSGVVERPQQRTWPSGTRHGTPAEVNPQTSVSGGRRRPSVVP